MPKVDAEYIGDVPRRIRCVGMDEHVQEVGSPFGLGGSLIWHPIPAIHSLFMLNKDPNQTGTSTTISRYSIWIETEDS